jgi:hypothetical protein
LIKLFKGSSHVVKKAWSSKDLLAWWSVSWFDLKTSLDNIL